ncbi:hypothetical protein [Vitiosangium sp. GDMCC 1.1324]|uniref:hypothetical protein n=1 Tax=Vitiosangium sp. (strain GDMCC 1.1324) TaxID=2138576 RepID=UPI000D36E56D|nr:hypothetical protein [Vitiosangium sp. GDMCC 1.1324]PTL84838.1 hypothetical protein DAT35_07215 [Vitiosangium sp. GDMCC 1.1324]
MSIRQKLSSRFRRHSEDDSRRSAAESPDASTRLERDRALEEPRRSEVCALPFSQDAAAVEEDE